MAKYTSTYESELLKSFVRNAKYGVVEIGLLDGETTKEVLTACTVPYYGIDPIIPDSANPGLIGNKDKIIKNCSWYKEFYFFNDYSFNIINNFDKKFDVIFIDGDHRYESISRDISDWWPKLENGGYLLIHDTAPITSDGGSFKGHEGPIRIVNEMKQLKYNYICTWDSITGFKKHD